MLFVEPCLRLSPSLNCAEECIILWQKKLKVKIDLACSRVPTLNFLKVELINISFVVLILSEYF